MPPELVEAWFLAFVLLAGIAAGSLALVWIGRILGRRWLTPLDDELRPAAFTLPLLLVLALPLALGLDALVAVWAVPERLAGWFDPEFTALRTLLYLALWSALAFLFTRRGETLLVPAIGLVLLTPTTALAGIDWVLPRGPFWWSSLFGFAFAVSQLPPALATAFLANKLQRETVDIAQDRSLVSALITTTLAVAWLWFVQFLAAWLANLPEEAAWYQARLVGERWVPLAVAAVALGAALVLLLQRHRGIGMVIAASVLILVQHVFHMAWLLRPVPAPALGPLDVVTILVLGGTWCAALWLLMRRQDRIVRALDQSGRLGSSQRGRSGGTSGGQSIASPERSE